MARILDDRRLSPEDSQLIRLEEFENLEENRLAALTHTKAQQTSRKINYDKKLKPTAIRA